jgi:hypothetical protein
MQNQVNKAIVMYNVRQWHQDRVSKRIARRAALRRSLENRVLGNTVFL